MERLVDNVKLLDRFTGRKPVGTLYLTATHLIFVDAEGKRETWILHMHMGQVEKQPLTAEGSTLQIRCKNFLCITFIIQKDRDCQDIYQSLLTFSRPAEIEKLYAFSFTSNEGQEKAQGWDMFDLQSEFLRMGAPNEHWVLTGLNREYNLCDTYPSQLYVPATASTPILMGSSKFRSRGRLPVLSYLHSENQAALTRCSQPLSGFSARCVEDEQMLEAILKSNPKSEYMYVVDTRPKINAMVNKAQGKGYENESFYSNMKFQFLGIENIHVMRASLQKLTELCELKKPSMNDFLSRLETCSWLKHISAVIDTSAFIARAISEGTSVLVHCSDGWDRTAQTCSLAGLMLDPYYRTMQGFQALIEKEWLSFGHKFTDRCGLLESVETKETSPVFTQFLECVWQIMQQFPCAFQFNERFLLTIHDHAYSCQFGTFIGNCEKDRLDLRLSEKTYSLWGYLWQHAAEFLNPLYKKEYEIRHPLIMPSSNPQALKFWRGMYNRFESGLHPRENVNDIVSAAKDHSSSLEDHVLLLEKRVTQICKLLGKSDETIQRKLQGYLSMDSIDGFLSGHIGDGPAPSKSSNHDDSMKNCIDLEPTLNGRLAAQADAVTGNHIKSDSESGFDECSSQMSRSGIDDVGALELSGLVRSPSSDQLSVDQLIAELKTVAVDWRSFRNVQSCSCASPFDYYVKKFHCWKCGEVFCVRCIARNISLPGHYHRKPVPVCKPCYKEVKRSPSVEFPIS
ncbi:myotubularin-related protein 6 [Aplysia californica]|uniref:phosphatidylinositol-3,5-bisphosphate 3-phosphatase n=1 Tax=Aplysia californica TaxID=6500 RepID=A0ABM0K894_APLCA|nr:myotubularin-related protein 6 [Aplysia californica]